MNVEGLVARLSTFDSKMEVAVWDPTGETLSTVTELEELSVLEKNAANELVGSTVLFIKGDFL